MPRQARIDYPGAFHHIIVRGLEKRNIFHDDRDRGVLVKRLEKVLLETSTPCYAWALMPNHFHLLLVTGRKPLSRVMSSLLTSYALYFNSRYKRSGYLFQNRYKSILCDRDQYFLELIRYIHLNPIRGNVLKNIMELDQYEWCGHSTIMGKQEASWQSIDEVLGLFGEKQDIARGKYVQYLKDGIKQGKREDLIGGGFVRSLGGWESAIVARRDGYKQMGDARILGDGEFVERVLRDADKYDAYKNEIIAHGWNPDRILKYVEEVFNLEEGVITRKSKQGNISKARFLASKLLIDELNMKTVDAAKLLKVSTSAVSKNIEQGRKIAKENNITLVGITNVNK